MMSNEDSEGLYPDQFVIHRDDELDLVDLVADAPGPAGAVETHLFDGVWVSVDFIEFERPLRATFEGDAPTSSIARTVGSLRADELAGELETDVDRPRVLESRVPPGVTEQVRRGRGSFLPGSNRMARAVGEVAVLESIGDDDLFDPITRAVALLEAATRRRRELRELADQAERILSDVTAAGRLLVDQEERLRRLAATDRFLALETSKEMALWREDHPAIRRAADALSSSPQEFREMPLVASSMSTRMLDAGLDFELDESVAFQALGTELDVELGPRGLLTVRTGVFEPDSWVRVVEIGPMVLLALVPLLDDDGSGIAHAVIGTGHSIDDLHIEVTSEPVRPTGNSLAATAQAVTLGREAAVRMAVDARSAYSLWESCARAWERLGDERRAEMSRRYAFGGGPDREGFIAERIDEVLGNLE